ncbi:diguanylate cyclase [Thiomonas sp. SCN 64-16]|uniref:diguanylate cyclase domain-containing protein n=1 Tax=Thiomonas sp. SCN 64-16 TaxID=1660151 RepID=UPI00257BB61A|nr:diguanylate cyclase [Thiomonas sp. SCN 64-16]
MPSPQFIHRRHLLRALAAAPLMAAWPAARAQSARQAEEVAGKLVAAVRSRSGAGAKSVRFTISVGVAEWSPDQSLVGGELMAEVDGALYKAKAKGRDGYAIAGLDNLPDSAAATGKIRLVS